MQPKIPREKKDSSTTFGNVMEQVKSASLFFIPEQPPNAVEGLLQIMAIKKVDADELVQYHRDVGRMKRESFISIATAYCAQAGRENQANHHEIAWMYLLGKVCTNHLEVSYARA